MRRTPSATDHTEAHGLFLLSPRITRRHTDYSFFRHGSHGGTRTIPSFATDHTEVHGLFRVDPRNPWPTYPCNPWRPSRGAEPTGPVLDADPRGRDEQRDDGDPRGDPRAPAPRGA